jgi:DNA-binding beta-propeller fold protein YncE
MLILRNWNRSLAVVAGIMALLFFCLLAGPVAHAGSNYVLTASNDLLVVDADQQRLVGEVPLGRFVKDIAVAPGGRFAYVAHSGGVEVVDLGSLQVVAHPVTMPARFLRLSADGSMLYALTYGSKKMRASGEVPEGYFLQLVDLTGKQPRAVQTMELGDGAFDFIVSPSTGTIHVLNLSSRTLAQRALTDGTLMKSVSIPGSTPATARAGEQGVLFRLTTSADGSKIFIPEMREECGLWEIDASSGATRWVSLGFEAYPRAMVVSPDGANLYVSSVKGIFTVDLKTLTVTRYAGCEEVHQGIGVSSDGTQLYSTIPDLEGGGALDIFDTTTLERVARVPIPGHSPFVVASAK